VWLKSWSRFYRNQSLWTRRPRKKLIAGIVLTGGGAQLKHIKQLVEYITGMDTRIGYPNEHLAGDSDEEFSSPLYATAVGLVMNGIDNQKHSAIKIDEIASPKAAVYRALLPSSGQKAGRSRGSGNNE
jgi:cell division protein FtsA